MLNKSHEQCLNKSLESELHVQSAMKPLHYYMIAFLGAVAEPQSKLARFGTRQIDLYQFNQYDSSGT